MRNLLEYLNMCLEFINEKPTEAIIDKFLDNISLALEDMTIEQIEAFELAFEALDLFYQRQINSINVFHSSLMDSSIADDIQLSFDKRLSKLDDFARTLECTVLFMGRVNDRIGARKNNLLNSTGEQISLK